jgi:hypothetical protein
VEVVEFVFTVKTSVIAKTVEVVVSVFTISKSTAAPNANGSKGKRIRRV